MRPDCFHPMNPVRRVSGVYWRAACRYYVCRSARNRAGDDTCTDRETKIQVASLADVAALSAQLDVLADRVNAHDALIEQLETLLPGELTVTENADGTVTVEGHHLRPDSQVRARQLLPLGGSIDNDAIVGPDGLVSMLVEPSCSPGTAPANFFAQGTDQSGASIQSNVILVC